MRESSEARGQLQIPSWVSNGQAPCPISRVANSSFDGETLALEKATTSSVFYGHCVDEYVQGRPRSLEARAFFGGADATVPVSRKTRVLQLSDGQGTVKAVTTTKIT